MSVAVLSLTRDRLAYTKHCFGLLHELAGCDFDHYVLDQGSQDGTSDWLRAEYAPTWVELLPENVGVSRGINTLVDQARKRGYDWYVKFDNDCELLTPNVLADALADEKWILSPHIHGLNEPPPIQRETQVNGMRVGVPPMIGGIFMAVPAWVFERYRHDESNPVWGMDDVQLCHWFRGNGGDVGYMLDHHANHYETTKGQEQRYPDYFERKYAEFYGR